MTTKDKRYFDWLCTLVFQPDNGKTYLGLLQILHDKEFVWTVGNDDNRIADGKDLRVFYLSGNEYYKIDRDAPASVLEVLIGISSRLAFLTDEDSRIWAWRLIKNLGLNKLSDPINQAQEDKANEILDTLIWRTYEWNGRGGFFPLDDPPEDQTKVEIWYQMSAYILENDTLYDS